MILFSKSIIPLPFDLVSERSMLVNVDNGFVSSSKDSKITVYQTLIPNLRPP